MAVATKRASSIPIMVASGVTGSAADMMYGYYVACEAEVDAYRGRRKGQ